MMTMVGDHLIHAVQPFLERMDRMAAALERIADALEEPQDENA